MTVGTYIIKSILAKLSEQVQEPDEREPGAPQQDLVHVLDIEHSEHEDELIEHVVPELVFDSLGLRHAELAKD